MFKPAADSWALEVARQVVDHDSFETTHIELKAQVPEPKKFVRQFAGLANAAGWHPVLVLLGIDREDGLVGIPSFEPGDWYQSLRSLFEYGEAPTLAYHNFLTLNDKQLAAFVFETDNPPYVVAESKQGGPREVPWRYGANTGSAGRRELLSLLLRRIADPEVEFTKVELRLSEEGNIRVHAELYIYPATSDELAIPVHRVQVQIADMRGAVQPLETDVSLRPISDASRAKWVDSTVIVPGTSKLQLTAKANAPLKITRDAEAIELSFTLRPARAGAPIRFSAIVTRRDHPDCLGYWELPQHHVVPLHTNEDTLRQIKGMSDSFAPRMNWNPFGTLPPPRGWDL